MNRISLQWGLIIGGASLLWLYLAYWTGLHTSGMALFNLFMFGWLLIIALGYWRGLGAVRVEGSKSGSWGYGLGLKCAALMALISAVVAVIAQIGYWTLVHPQWPDYMIEQTRIHLEARGITGTELESAISEGGKFHDSSGLCHAIRFVPLFYRDDLLRLVADFSKEAGPKNQRRGLADQSPGEGIYVVFPVVCLHRTDDRIDD